MTIVAWDGTTLAADRQTTSGSTRCTPTTKIAEYNGQLYGWAGNLAEAGMLREWVRAGANPADWPTFDKDARASLIVVRSPTLLHEYTTGTRYPTSYDAQQCFAIGSGEEAAYALLRAGHSALDTVRHVAATNIYCGDGYNTLSWPVTEERLSHNQMAALCRTVCAELLVTPHDWVIYHWCDRLYNGPRTEAAVREAFRAYLCERMQEHNTP